MSIFTVSIFYIKKLLNYQFVFINNPSLSYTFWLKENTYLSNIEVIGTFLYTDFFIIFILCGLVLLVAMIGAIVLTMHQRSTIKKQQINMQLLRNASGVVKFLKLRK